MSYIVSARKYRPKTFEDVVGQEQITTTLKRSIETGHLAQAFLFCGPRGVGKTTCARIMAKAVNTGKTEKLDEIKEDFSFNIFELDAASNNKVDDMHQLIAQVRIPPQTGKYKIYIIDEVHMLSTAAFNAFLKTLEEPPPYAIFILATTEKHKILPTILSRCQIYDFRRISVLDIVKHLQDIAKQENIIADESALHIIAEKADGALRDALSIFDRLVSFSGSQLTYEAAVTSLNVLDYDYFFKITEQVLSGDLPASLITLDGILGNGFEGDHFVNGLSNHYRNLLVCQDPRSVKLLEVSEALKQRYFEQAKITPLFFLVNALSLASDCDVRYSASINKRLLVEAMLMKMSYLNKIMDGKPIFDSSEIEKKNLDIQITQPYIKEQARAKAPETNESAAKGSAPAQEVPQAEIIKKQSGISLSLDDLEKAVDEELRAPQKEEDQDNKLVEEQGSGTYAFNHENLQALWIELLESLPGNKLKSLYDIIYDKLPSLTDTTIHLIADSAVEKTLIVKDLNAITSFFKSKFEDKNFNFKITVEEDESKQKVILNQKDKYLKMIQTNPLLQKLKENLDLELEL